MSLDLNDEILQDFLVEAGEILENLNEQLLELEKVPDDKDMLNSVFRGFHTVKGGAGFLGLENLVEVCHKAEDVFNLLRNGEREIDSSLMDVILQVLDDVNGKFEEVRSGNLPSPSAPGLLKSLAFYADRSTVGSSADFEIKKDAPKTKIHNDSSSLKKQKEDSSSDSSGANEITDDEFEALLDSLHGEGYGPSGPGSAESDIESGNDLAPGSRTENKKHLSSGDEISDDEFELVLDQIHGKGKAPSGTHQKSSVESQAPASIGSAQEGLIGGSGRQVSQDKKSEPSKPAQPPGRSAMPAADSSVRVDTKSLDDIMNLVGELVLVRNRLSTLKDDMSASSAIKAIENLDLVTSDLQSAVMKTRMQPVKKVFGRFPRVVRDLARSLKKEVSLELYGEDTDLDKNLVEALSDPLVHLVRNSVDHGIELPDDREASGKPRAGSVSLSAMQEGDHILISIKDDGKGMDAELLRQKAVEKGIMDHDTATRLSETDCFNLIFHPGFSTKEEISDVSGRGVGMDVVKTKIAQLNGSIVINSEKGVGTTIEIKLPLTLAILPTLMVGVGEQIFALPLSSVNEILDLDLTKTNSVDGKLVFMVRDKALPIHYLHEKLINSALPERGEIKGPVVVVHIGNAKVGFVVDTLLGQEEVVIKPLGNSLHGLAGFAGATITGDGRIALILDLQSMLGA